MPHKILVVEDEPTLQETLKYNLEHAGYQVVAAGDGVAALEYARNHPFDLILMDIMLPGLDGIEITRILRNEQSTPIVMLTAKDDEIDRVLGLEIGADDYLTKPFSMRELIARVKAQLRRVRLIEDEINRKESHQDASLTFGDLVLDTQRREVFLGQETLVLKPKEYELLHYLAIHQGKALSRDLILEEVWGWDYSGGSRSVDVHIRWLREKIEEDPAHPRRITTLRGVGYRFEG
jgi:DNA-binding response OmpR family regulator